MSERSLQSLVILLAGLFSAEQARSSSFSWGRLPTKSADEERADVDAQRTQESEH